MPAKLHINGGIKSVKVSDRHRVIKENKKYKMTVNMFDKNKVFLYTDFMGLKKIKQAIDAWWVEYLNDTD